MRPRALAVGLIAIAAAALMCAAPTEIVVDVYTEVDCAKRPTTTFTAVASLQELTSHAVTSTLTGCAPRVERSGRIVLSPSDARDATVAFQVVTRNDGDDPERTCSAADARGCIVARRQLRFVPGASTRVDVALRLSCLDKPCLPEETCVNGGCQSAVLTEGCLGAVCAESELPPPLPPGGDAGPPRPGDDASTQEDADATGLPPTVGSVARVYQGAASVKVRGLSTLAGGLAWVELRAAPQPPLYLMSASWTSLATPVETASGLESGFGLSFDVGGVANVLGQQGPGTEQGPTCVRETATNGMVRTMACAGPLEVTYGVAYGTAGGAHYIGGEAPGLATARIAWFDGGDVHVTRFCEAGPSGVRYLELQGTRLAYAASDGVYVADPTTFVSGSPCGAVKAMSLPNSVGVALLDGDLCGGSPSGIHCVGPGFGAATGTFVVAPPPSEDLAFRRVGGQLYVYYAAGSAIWVARVR